MSFIFNIKKDVKHVFLHIPKNGGKSLVTTFKRFNPSETGTRSSNILKGHFTYLETKEKFKNQDIKYFCIIRNPWDRMVSYYNYIGQIKSTVHGIHNLHNKIKKGLTFEKFVDEFIKDGRREFRPQIDYIVDENEEVVVETLMLDIIQSDVDSFLKRNDYKPKVVMEKLNISEHNNYKSYYESDELIKKIADFEVGIIEKFKFEFKK